MIILISSVIIILIISERATLSYLKLTNRIVAEQFFVVVVACLFVPKLIVGKLLFRKKSQFSPKCENRIEKKNESFSRAVVRKLIEILLIPCLILLSQPRETYLV